jgi:hypothetical protein
MALVLPNGSRILGMAALDPLRCAGERGVITVYPLV